MNKCNILTPPSTGFSVTQFSTFDSAGINHSEGPEKYNNTEVKYRGTVLQQLLL
jgi:hypothetical protein